MMPPSGCGKLSLLLLILSVCCPLTPAINPGLKVRLSQPGLNYAASVAVNILSSKVGSLAIPEMSGKARFGIVKVDYRVTNTKVTRFQPPTSAVTVNPGSGLTWTLNGAAIWIHGDWHYSGRVGPIKVSDHGTFDASASGISISVSVTVGASATGEPTILATGCNCNIGSLHIKTHGGASWLYNLFIKYIERPIHADLQKQVCESARKAINEDAARELSTLKVKVIILRNWLLDYRLIAAPAFASGYIESFHKGEFFAVNDPAEAPFQPAPLPSPPSADHMVTFWVSDYVVNTAGHVLHRQGAMKGVFTKKDLPADMQQYLDTTCSPFKCIGSIVPQIGKTFPNATVEVEVTTLAAPNVNVDQRRVVGNFVELAVFRARLSNGSLAHLFDLNVTAKVSVTPRIEANVLKASVNSIDEAMSVVRSSIGEISVSLLKMVVDTAKVKYIIPHLDTILGIGFAIPSIKHVEFVNTALQLEANCLSVKTDVKYKQLATEDELRFDQQLYA